MQKQTFDQLFKKYKAGHCTAEEKQLLYQWYNAFSNSPFPKLAEGELEELASESWDTINKKTQEPRRLQLWQRAAAAILLIGTVSTLLYVTLLRPESSKEAQDFTTTNSQHIVHENSHAQLHLPDGTILSLEKEEDIIYHTSLINQSNTAVQELTVSTARGSSFALTLPDGSTVLLSPLSKISFPSAFTGHKRQVELEGQAYFDIIQKQHSNSSDRQGFEVISGNQRVSVLGTKFSVQHYPEASYILTTLEEGSVRVESIDMSNIHSEVLKPGEQSAYSTNGLQVYPVDLDIIHAWKNGEFAFTNQTLETLIKQLSNWYDVDFEWVNTKSKKETFEGYFPLEKSITSVLQAIENTGKVKFKIKDRTIYIH